MPKAGNGTIIHGSIAVDKWSFQQEELMEPPRLYFLSHFHSDHIQGLNAAWNHPIYTSPQNCDLARHFVKTDRSLFIPLELNKDHVLKLGADDEPKVIVTLMDANHVPGAVMFLFQGFFGNVLYTADFRHVLIYYYVLHSKNRQFQDLIFVLRTGLTVSSLTKRKRLPIS